MIFEHTILRTDPNDNDKPICVDVKAVGTMYEAIPGDRINQPEAAYFEIHHAYNAETDQDIRLTENERLEIERTAASENDCQTERRLMRSLFQREARR